MNKLGFLLSFCLLATSCSFNLDSGSGEQAQGPYGINLEEDYAPFEASNPTQSTLTLENGIEVLIISNPSFAKASAALSVPVGSMSDPRDHQGIAHFLEHLLFLGTGKYPVVGEYKDFIKKNGGHANAYTSYDETNYQFETTPVAFAETLDRFSRFFIDPLLDANYVEKERNAVSSEFNKNYQLTPWRFNHLMGQLAPEDHIFHTFRVGNNESLKTTTRDQVLAFYNKYYSANLMKLVLMGPQSKADLEALARKSFSEVPNKNLIAPNYQSQSSLPTKELVKIKSLTPEKSLMLFFPVPTFTKYPQSKPDEVIGQFLGIEGKGSLDESLKDKGYILKTSAGAETLVTESFITTEFQLTEKGEQHIPEIIAEFFASIESIKKELKNSQTYSDLAQIKDLGFKYTSLDEGADVAAAYAKKMHKYPALKIDSISTQIKSQRSELVAEYLTRITPENLAIFYSGPNLQTDKKESFFGVEYSRSPIPDSYLALIKKLPAQDYSVPAPNQYIAKDFKLKTDSVTAKPYRLVNDQRGKAWFLQESRHFNLPKARVYLGIMSPDFAKDARTSVISRLYLSLISDKLNSWATPIFQSHNGFSIEHNGRGLSIKVAGFSDQTVKILKDLISRLQTTSFTEQDFAGAKEKIKTALATERKGEAYEQVSKGLDDALSNYFPSKELEDMIDEVSFAEVKNFPATGFKQIRTESFFYGNLDPSEVSPLLDYTYATLGASKISDLAAQELEGFTRKIPEGKQSVYSFKGENNNNAFIKAYYTGPRTPKVSVLAQAMGLLINAPYYTAMRTEKQYGYVVGSQMDVRLKESSYDFIIQSGTHPLDEIVRASDSFVQSHLTAVKGELDQALPFIKQSLERTTVAEDINMESVFERYINYIFNRGENPNYREDLVAEIQKLTAKDIADYIDTYFLGPKKSTFTVIHVGEGFKDLTLQPDETQVENLGEFRGL